MTSNPTQNPFPLLNSPFLDERGYISFAWYQYLSALFTKTGGTLPASTSSTLQFVNEILTAFASNGQAIGPISYTNTPVQPGVLLDPVISPFIYTAGENGFLICGPSATVLFSRDHLTFFPVTMDGGQIVLLHGDQVQVQWSGTPPSVVWFGGNT